MPLKNSHFRIVSRHRDDPHGAEGYFIHEIYVREDGTVSGWRAGVSLGHLAIEGLKQHVIRMIDAFNHEPIEYKDLAVSGFKLPTLEFRMPDQLELRSVPGLPGPEGGESLLRVDP